MMQLTRPEQGDRASGRVLPRAVPGELKFGPVDGFHHELQKRVAEYFQSTGRRPRDCTRMYLKTAIILGWLAASYGLLLLGAGTWWLALPIVISLGLAMAACGFNIQHDGGRWTPNPTQRESIA